VFAPQKILSNKAKH